MFDLVECLLRICYYYALLMGVLNFEIDLRTGRARSTRRSSIYSALVNVLCILWLPLLSSTQVIHAFWSRAEKLHVYMFSVLLGGRILCVLVTLLSRWSQRRRFIRLVNAFQRLSQQKPQVKLMWRRGVLSKFISVLLTDSLHTLTSMVIIWDSLTLRLMLTILTVSGITALVNIIISHYYFALLNVHGHYVLLNQELRAVLMETRSLESERGKGVFVIKCCALADRLEAIARAQSQLQRLVEDLTSIFGWQTISNAISYYLTAVAVIYFTWSKLNGATRLSWSSWGVALFYINIVCQFSDLHVSLNIMFSVLDVHAEMVKLLSENTLFAAGLDQRLEAIFESFQLQLAWNPLRLSVLGIFNTEKSIFVSFASSIVTSSLLLLQNDFKSS